LRSLQGDEGARALLRGSAPLTLVEMPEAALDVDTPADVRRLRGGAPPSTSRARGPL
jgi:CTP:molybdopterin cytidylyltransferase MocA